MAAGRALVATPSVLIICVLLLLPFLRQGRDANKKLQRAIRAAKLRDRLPAMLVSWLK